MKVHDCLYLLTLVLCCSCSLENSTNTTPSSKDIEIAINSATYDASLVINDKGLPPNMVNLLTTVCGDVVMVVQADQNPPEKRLSLTYLLRGKKTLIAARSSSFWVSNNDLQLSKVEFNQAIARSNPSQAGLTGAAKAIRNYLKSAGYQMLLEEYQLINSTCDIKKYFLDDIDIPPPFLPNALAILRFLKDQGFTGYDSTMINKWTSKGTTTEFGSYLCMNDSKTVKVIIDALSDRCGRMCGSLFRISIFLDNESQAFVGKLAETCFGIPVATINELVQGTGVLIEKNGIVIFLSKADGKKSIEIRSKTPILQGNSGNLTFSLGGGDTMKGGLLWYVRTEENSTGDSKEVSK